MIFSLLLYSEREFRPVQKNGNKKECNIIIIYYIIIIIILAVDHLFLAFQSYIVCFPVLPQNIFYQQAIMRSKVKSSVSLGA